MIVYPVGIPAGFLWLLYRYKVPWMAKQKITNAWLQQIVEHVWRLQIDQPAVNVDELTSLNISDEHLDLLYTIFCDEDDDDAEMAELERQASSVLFPCYNP